MLGAVRAAALHDRGEIAEALLNVTFTPTERDDGHLAFLLVAERRDLGRASAEVPPQRGGHQVGRLFQRHWPGDMSLRKPTANRKTSTARPGRQIPRAELDNALS